MDPYLEDEPWSNFHGWFAPEIAGQLNSVLPEEYAALINKRVVMVDEVDFERKEKAGYPDVEVVRELSASYRSRGGSAVADPPVTMPTSAPFRMSHLWVEVIRASNRAVITSIEILSPWNKVSRDRSDCLRKRDRILVSATHLLEIDLLRRGQRVPVEGQLPLAPYFVFLSRAGNRPLMGIWPIQVRDPLPVVPVPLERQLPDVPLDLHAAVSEVYRKSRYDFLIDYSLPPPPGPLTEAESTYVADVTKGIAAQ